MKSLKIRPLFSAVLCAIGLGPAVAASNDNVARALTAAEVAEAFGLPADALVLNAFETVAGSTLAVSASAPATENLAGYSATSMVYSPIGEITDLPGVAGRTYATVSHKPIGSRQEQRKKGSFSLEDVTVVMAWDQSDAGQDICRTASENDDILTFKLTKQGGHIRYFRAQVSAFIENMGTIDNVVQGSMTLLRQTVTVSDPA